MYEYIMGIGGQGAGNLGLSGGNTRGDTHSNYESVTSQAGIYAGNEGFDINVKGNTDLKGAVIDSHAPSEKNTLTTGTLTWEDIGNNADYKAGTSGTSYQTGSAGGKTTGSITPVRTQDVKDKASSTTKSAIAEGTVTIKNQEDQKQDIGSLNRDTKGSLNKLAQIFDKEDVKERQELVNTFSQVMNEKIGDIAAEKGWAPDDPRRAGLHALAGGFTAAMGGGNALSGAAGAGIMESLQPVLDQFVKDHPDMREEASALIGSTVGKLTGDTNAGEAAAWSSTKFNWLTHEQEEQRLEELQSVKSEKEKDKVLAKWLAINDAQGDEWLNKQGTGAYLDVRTFRLTVIGNQGSIAQTGDVYNWKTSRLNNILTERSGDMWEFAIQEGKWNGVWKYTGKLGGPVGLPLALIEPYQDYHKYSGINLAKAWVADTFPVIGGFVGSYAGPIGTITGGMGGDYAKYQIKKNIPTGETIKIENEKESKR